MTSDPASDAIAARVRGQKHFYYHNGTEFVAYPDNGINTTAGGTFFNLDGKLFAVEPIGTPAYLDGFQVVNINDNKIVATHTAQFTASAYQPNPNSITAEVTGDYEAKLYQYVPGQLAAQYTFKLDTTTGIEDVAVESGEDVSIYVNGDALTVSGIVPASIEVYSAAGAIAAQGKDTQIVNVSALPAGIYVVKATEVNGNTITGKVSIK